MNTFLRTAIAAGAWLLLATSINLSNAEAAVAIVTLTIYLIGGD